MMKNYANHWSYIWTNTLRKLMGIIFVSHRFEQNLTEQTYKQTLEKNVNRLTDIIKNLKKKYYQRSKISKI